jgi:hypothetical protein
MHKFRVLLLLPFVVSHFLFYFSLHDSCNGNASSFKNAPLQFNITNPSIQALQLAKVKQVSKGSCASSQSCAHDLCAADDLSKKLIRVVTGHGNMLSRTVTSYNAPTLFPTRASPA